MRSPLLLAFLAVSTAIFVACSSETDALRGTALTSNSPAPAFTLQNHLDETVSVSDYLGKVVLITFLYTNCADVCPIVTSQIRDAHAMLEEDSDSVALIAISVDPKNDTVQAAFDYSELWGMTDRWDYLVGDEQTLEPIWKSYYVDPFAVEGEENPAQVTVSTGVDALRQNIGLRFSVIHSAPVYLIDRQGIMREVFTSPLEVEDIALDLRLLMES